VPKISLVLHDWNGCLLDDVPHRYEYGVCTIFRQFGLPVPTLEDYSHNITSDFVRFYYDRGFPASGNKEGDAVFLDAIMTAAMAETPIPPLFSDTQMFLSSLQERSITQTLVSALAEKEFHRQVGHHGLEPYFAAMRGGIRKKAPVFKGLLDAYGVDPSQVVGVTDMMSDARELAEVGVTPIILPRGYITPDTKEVPTLVVADDFSQALRYIDHC
jgi:phosphoglycolate phosphatase-like HAD superfamily hydrolase